MQLSAYRVVSELGSGGMGKVYRAELVDEAAGLGRGTVVALKLIHPHLLEKPGFFKRFLREAQIGQQVEHENVVRTYDCDAAVVDGTQYNFLVMEYVEGQTLRELLEELGRVPEELCRHIGREVARGLGAIHDVGVVHRDIKPENVLITEAHVVKVMDLGVARLKDEASGLSETGTFVGSIEYAAPEQFRWDTEPDGRADLYALGVMLYEFGTGQHPFRDEDRHRTLKNIMDGEPRRAGEANPQLSPFFEELVHSLMAKECAARFQTAEDLVLALDDGEDGAWWTGRATELRVETRQPLRRIRVPRETALYGRDDELQKLEALFQKTQSGEGQALLIEGEAGIGKTRLIDEFVGRLRQAGEELNFLFGSYPPGGAATGSGAFSTAYREHFGAEMLEQTLAGYLVETPLLIPAFGALLRGDATPVGAEPLTEDSLQTVFVHATRGLAAERPTIVLIDDLHLAPEGGRALFASLAMALGKDRVLLVGASRPDVQTDWAANLEPGGYLSRMVLSRLGPKDLFQLLRDSFRSERLAEQLGMQVSMKSDGNPFFAFEIIRGLREGQLITQEPDGTWVSTQVIQQIEIPSSVMDLIQARLRDLSEQERELLDIASCCGFEFSAGLVAAVMELPRIPALRAFARMEKAHRLVRSRGRVFAFDHHQVQEALYEGQPEELREAYHAAIGEALEARERATERDPRDLDGSLLVELCEHFLKGARGTEAVRYLGPALDCLEAGYLHEPAITLAERALVVPGLIVGAERVEILLRLNQALHLLGRRDEQDARLDEAVSAADRTGDAVLAARVRSARGSLFQSTSRYEAALAEYEAALERARSVGAREQEAEALRGRGWVLQRLARYDEATAHLEQSLEIFRETGDLRGEAAASGNLGAVCSRQGRNKDAIARYERVMEIAEELDDRGLVVLAAGNLGAVFQAQGRNEAAREQKARAVRICREIGDRTSEATNAGNLANTFSAEGRAAEALERYEQIHTIHLEVGNRRDEAVNRHNQATVLARLGALEASEALHREALDTARAIGFRFLQPVTLTQLARTREEHGDKSAAEGLFEEALAQFEAIGAGDEHKAAGHFHYAAFLARSGREDEARVGFGEALTVATGADAPGVRVLARIHLVLLGQGSAEEAHAAFTETEPRLELDWKAEGRLLLYRATGDKRHLEAAHDLLEFFVEHAPEAYRETTLVNVRLHREIMEAWAES